MTFKIKNKNDPIDMEIQTKWKILDGAEKVFVWVNGFDSRILSLMLRALMSNGGHSGNIIHNITRRK